MKDVVLNEVKEKYMISKEDFKNYFNENKIITKEEYGKYLKNNDKMFENIPDFFPTEFYITLNNYKGLKCKKPEISRI